MHTFVTTMQETIKQLQDQVKQLQIQPPQANQQVVAVAQTNSILDWIKSFFKRG